MSTRATYQIKTDLNHSTIYIHHDGYPSGAARYMRNAIDLMRITNRPLFPSFIWANEKAEMTESHECHGDTEYRYSLYGKEGAWWVTAYERDFRDDSYNPIFDGRVERFIDKHGERKDRAAFLNWDELRAI